MGWTHFGYKSISKVCASTLVVKSLKIIPRLCGYTIRGLILPMHTEQRITDPVWKTAAPN